MLVQTIRTPKVTAGSHTIFQLLDESLTALSEGSVLVVSSKIVSLCEGRTKAIAGTDLQSLVRDEAEWYMPEVHAQHGYTFTIAHNMLTPNSGIDESNANGMYVLWPEDPQRSANEIRAYLGRRFGLRSVAVVIADSDFLPLRWGAIGLALSYSGIVPVRSYKERVDLFGRPLKLTRTDVVDSIATAATLIMGEGDEQTPLAVITDIPDVQFIDRDPSNEEVAARHIPPEEDSFGPLLTGVSWSPGGRSGKE